MKFKSFKKLMAVLLVLGMMLSCFSISAIVVSANNKVKFSIDAPEKVIAGEKFTVSVNVANGDDVYAGSFYLNFDNSLCEATEEYTAGNVISSGGFTSNYNNFDKNVFFGFFNAVSPLPSDGTVLNVVFTAKDNVEGQAVFSFSEILLSDINFKPIESATVDKTVAIVKETQSVTTVMPVVSTTVTEPTESTAQKASSSTVATDPTESTAQKASSSAVATDPTESTVQTEVTSTSATDPTESTVPPISSSIADTDPSEKIKLSFDVPFEAISGESFKADIHIDNAGDVYTGSLVINYDAESLVLLDFSLGGLIASDEYNSMVNKEYGYGQLFLMFYNIDTPIDESGTLISLTFDVKESSAGPLKFGFSDVLMGDVDSAELECEVEEATVNVAMRGTIPFTSEVVPPATEIEPPTSEEVPPTTETEPPTSEEVPPTTETEPPTSEVVPPTTETEPPTSEVVPPTTEVIPGDTSHIVITPAELYLEADEFIEGQRACVTVGVLLSESLITDGTISLEFVDEVLDFVDVTVYGDYIDGNFEATVDEGVLTVSFNNCSALPVGKTPVFDVRFDVGNPEYWWSNDDVEWFSANFEFVGYEFFTDKYDTIIDVVTPEWYSFDITQTTNNNPVYEILMGDCDFSGKINIKDATLIQKHLAKMGVEFDEIATFAANVINSDKLNIKDATTIQKYCAMYTVDAQINVYVEYIGEDEVPSAEPEIPPTDPEVPPTEEPETDSTVDENQVTIMCNEDDYYGEVGETFTYELLLSADETFEYLYSEIEYSANLSLVNIELDDFSCLNAYDHCPELCTGYDNVVLALENGEDGNIIRLSASDDKGYDFVDTKTALTLTFEILYADEYSYILTNIIDMGNIDGTVYYSEGYQVKEEGVIINPILYN